MDRALTYLLYLFLILSFAACSPGGSGSPGKGKDPDGINKPQPEVVGPFPLGDPGFTAQYKTFLRSTPYERFVFAANGNEIHVVNDKGVRVHSFIPDKVHSITGLWVEEGGAIYVTGQESDPPTKQFLRKYDFNGTLLNELVTYTGPKWTMPLSPMVGTDGSIYLLEAIGNRIKKFDPTGKPIFSIGGKDDKENGELSGPSAYTVDGAGNIYVVDMKTDRMQKFDSAGKFVSKISWPRQIPGSVVSDIIINETNFIVAERMGAKGRVTSFTQTGSLNWSRDGSEHRAPYLGNLMSLTLQKNKLFLGIQDSLIVYAASDGSFLKKFVKRMNSPKCVIRGPHGEFFVGSNNGIHLYNNKGAFQKTFGPMGTPIMGLAIDSRNNLYAIDLSDPSKILKFDLDGNPLESLRVKGLVNPYSLSIDKDDFLYVADASGNVMKIATVGKSISQFGAGNFTSPAGVTVANDGTVIVMDLENGVSIGKRFSPSGQLLGTFGKANPGALFMGLGVSSPKNGKIYVTDATAHKVLIYNKDGNYVASFGSKGEGLDKLNQPMGIFVDSEGLIYVADGSNHVVKKFKDAGTPMIF